MLQGYFGDLRISQNEKFEKNQIQEGLSIDWMADPHSLYTVILYDMSAPTDDSPIHSPYVHFLAVNIPANRVQESDVVLSYRKPDPPFNSGTHTYAVDLFLQKEKIHPVLQNRKNMNIIQFVEKEKLSFVDRLLFKISNLRTTELEEPSTKSSKISKRAGGKKEDWVFKNLPEREKKYCRCVVEVAASQPEQCNREKSWFQKRQGEKCYNPYAVCAKSTKTTSRRCGENYNFSKLPDLQLRAYASLNKISIPRPYNRDQLISNIQAWKNQE